MAFDLPPRPWATAPTDSSPDEGSGGPDHGPGTARRGGHAVVWVLVLLAVILVLVASGGHR